MIFWRAPVRVFVVVCSAALLFALLPVRVTYVCDGYNFTSRKPCDYSTAVGHETARTMTKWAWFIVTGSPAHNFDVGVTTERPSTFDQLRNLLLAVLGGAGTLWASRRRTLV